MRFSLGLSFSMLAAILSAAALPSSQLMAQTTTPTKTITPNENLVVEGITAIPAALAQKVNRYTQFRSASLATWHPTKREMLISTRFADVAQVHHVQSPLGARQQLTFFPNASVEQHSNRRRASILFSVRTLAAMNLHKTTAMTWPMAKSLY